MKRVILVGCSKSKSYLTLEAKYLYNGALFVAGRKLAERTQCPWFVVSALHGLVDPNQKLKPYEAKLSGLSREERAEWGRKVFAKLRVRLGPGRVRVTVLAGQDYSDPIQDAAEAELVPFREQLMVDAPLYRLGIGNRKRFFAIADRFGEDAAYRFAETGAEPEDYANVA